MCCHVIPDHCGPSEHLEPLANKSFCILYSVRSSCNSIPSYTATMYYKYRPVILPPTSYEGTTFVSLSKGISNNSCTHCFYFYCEVLLVCFLFSWRLSGETAISNLQFLGSPSTKTGSCNERQHLFFARTVTLHVNGVSVCEAP